jgi:hypothetical protein
VRGLAHPGGEGLADQPGHDQHHALDAKGDEDGEQRRGGEVAQAVEGGVAGGQGERERRRPEQRQLPVAEQHLLDDAQQPVHEARAPEREENGKKEERQQAIGGCRPNAVGPHRPSPSMRMYVG